MTELPETFLERRLRESSRSEYTDVAPPFPRNALIELSNACNHSCVFCANTRMTRTKGFLSVELFRSFMEQAVPLGLREVGLYSTGEPFVSKNLAEFVRIAKEAGAEYIYMTSNGALATPSRAAEVIDAGLSSIKFSINAGSRESYALVHGRDEFDRVIEHLRFINEYRRATANPLRVMASCVVTRFTEGEREDLRRLVEPLVDELVFNDVDGQQGQSLIELTKLEPVHRTGSAFTPTPPCALLWNRVHVTCEGYLTFCCVDFENALVFADLRTERVAAAWNNETAMAMRQRHLTKDLEGTLCHSCIYGGAGAVYPLTTIAHRDRTTPIVLNRRLGVESVAARIDALARRGMPDAR